MTENTVNGQGVLAFSNGGSLVIDMYFEESCKAVRWNIVVTKHEFCIKKYNS